MQIENATSSWSRYISFIFKSYLALSLCGLLTVSHLSVIQSARAETLATVDGVPVSSQLYFSHIERLHETHPRAKGKPKLENRLSKRALMPLVSELVLRKEADRVGVSLTSLSFEDPIAVLLKTHKTEERLEDYLRRIGETRESIHLKKWINATTGLLMERAGLLKISEEEVRAEYVRQEPFLKREERVRAAQLLIKLPSRPTREQINKGFQAIQVIHKRSLAGEPFHLLVQRHSEGPLRSRGGDIGFVAKGDMVKVVEDTIWSLKEDDVSSPIRSKYGWHLIKRGARQAPSNTPYDDVQKIFNERLRSAKFRKGKRAYMKRLWTASKIDSALPLRY